MFVALFFVFFALASTFLYPVAHDNALLWAMIFGVTHNITFWANFEKDSPVAYKMRGFGIWLQHDVISLAWLGESVVLANLMYCILTELSYEHYNAFELGCLIPSLYLWHGLHQDYDMISGFCTAYAAVVPIIFTVKQWLYCEFYGTCGMIATLYAILAILSVYTNAIPYWLKCVQTAEMGENERRFSKKTNKK